MLHIHDLHKAYGQQVLFDGVTLQLNPGERVGLIGRNGHGKSTLLRLIIGEEEADAGTIHIPRHYRIGHLVQHIRCTRPTVLEEGCLGLPPDEVHDHYKVERILFGLGFTETDMQRPPTEFSGGFQIRLHLTKVLVAQPNLLLLDEPTNYLDILSIRWITKFLRSWPGELLLISHDRTFMDAVTTHTAAIHRQSIRKLPGGTEKLYAQLEQDEAIHEKTRVKEEKRRKEIESFVHRFRAKARQASLVQSRLKLLEKMGTREKLEDVADLDFAFHFAPFNAKRLTEVQQLSFHFVPEQSLIHNLSFTIAPGDRIGVIGKNGRGKSTLLNLLARELTPCNGSINSHPQCQIGYFGQTNIDRLHAERTVEEEVASANPTLDRTRVRTICGIMMFSGDDAEKRVAVLSGGERSRVLLAKIVAMPANCLLLDEPTNHLDMESVDALVESMHAFPGAILIVTHNEMILHALATKLIVFHQGGADYFDGTYAEFLDKIGWEEEAGENARRVAKAWATNAEATPLPTTAAPESTKKERRRQRSVIVAEQSRVLAPLKQEIAALEQQITQRETEIAAANQALIDASQSKDVAAFVALSKTLKTAQQAIDAHFARLETVTQQYEAKQQHYTALLSESPDDNG
ncbi:MAG: ATP-binding cassette domain-containing protein [Deltaproteobacteria bacterium]|nr:ATP-binding cassette domain-containing protein [Deltaproteobacteria bacterium]